VSFRELLSSDEFVHVAIKLLTTIVGLIELNGRLPGRIKFAGDGGSSKPLVILGELKSSISSLNIIPVDFERIIAPNLLNKDACEETAVLYTAVLLIDFSTRLNRFAFREDINCTLNENIEYRRSEAIQSAFLLLNF